jgi:lysophospholipase L1-like esterase
MVGGEVRTRRDLSHAAARVLAALGLVAALVGCEQQTTQPAASRPPAYPSSMDALGTSTTRGYNTDCPTAWIDCPDNSWATGTNAAVHSIYLRLLALNPRLRNNNANDAVSGSMMADLVQQARSAVRRNVELVTIAMGTNDACGGRAGVMTKVSAFRTDFTRAMDTLTSGLPQASIRVVSIPNVYRWWELFHADPNAVKAWSAAPFCDTLLADPTSSAKADVDRRAAVRARVVDFNNVLAQVCAAYPRCRTDGGAAFNAPVTTADVSTNDYWHPSIAGQSVTARVVWRAFGF